jgi:hypothetical protein
VLEWLGFLRNRENGLDIAVRGKKVIISIHPSMHPSTYDNIVFILNYCLFKVWE